MSENNLSARQQTMAEHELEMQRQILSVPNATSVPGPPQMPLLPPPVLRSGIPQSLNIPPPPMPPQNLPPPRTSQPVIPPVSIAPSGISQPPSIPPPCAPPGSTHSQAAPPSGPPAVSHPRGPPPCAPPAIIHPQAPPPPCAPPPISHPQTLPPPSAPPPITHSQAPPPPCAPPAISRPQAPPPPVAPSVSHPQAPPPPVALPAGHPQAPPPPIAPPVGHPQAPPVAPPAGHSQAPPVAPPVNHSQAPPPPVAPPPNSHPHVHQPMRAPPSMRTPPPISMPPGPPPPVMPPKLPPPVMPRQNIPPPNMAPQNLPHPPAPPPNFARPTVPPPNVQRPTAPTQNSPNLSIPPPQNIPASLSQSTTTQAQTPPKETVADTSNTRQSVTPTDKLVADVVTTPTTSSKTLPIKSQPASTPEPQWDEAEIVQDNANGVDTNKDLQGLSPEEEDEKLKKPTEVVLPKALEDVLALKDQRAAQMDDDIFTVVEEQLISQTTAGVISNEYADADGDSDDEADVPMGDSVLDKQPVQGKLNKNKRKKRRRKQSRKLRLTGQTGSDKSVAQDEEKPTENGEKAENNDDVAIEYIPERITIADLAPMYRQFYRVFEIFKLENKPKPAEADKIGTANETNSQQKKVDEKAMDDDDDDPEEDKQDDKEKLSKRKLKKLTRLSVAELKQLVSRPDVVEMHDVTARDPKLLVQLKAHRNTVQVPRHWCFKRKYLQGKRGIEKPPFDLPAFIKKTGIMEMRESLQEKDEAKSLKAKMRERTRPKMGKIDIDYQKLHDAFFKWQTKPRMTIHGDLYYEGKEFETRLKEKKPGDLSEELRIALGMPVGPSCHKIPPPWLIAQQRYGPPPSYPNLKIPGLNAPIPDGTSFGYHAGGWGKPPVDENGKPLYGDVFGTNIVDLDNGVDEGDIERNTWGELESESEESSEEEEDEGEDLVNPPDETGLVTPAEGLVTPSGLTSVPAGMETPDNIELRKRKIEAEMEDNETPVLYQVLPEKRTDRVGASMMGSTHVYDVGGVKAATLAVAGATRAPAIGDREGMVELALDPSELDMDSDAMAQRYEQQMREQQSHLQKEDLSDMLAEHVARQKSKRKRQQADTTKQTKKYKEFKF